MVRRIGPALVIEIVHQTDDAPALLVLAELAGVSPHGRFDRQHVFDQAGVLGVFMQQGNSVGTVHSCRSYQAESSGSIRDTKWNNSSLLVICLLSTARRLLPAVHNPEM